VITKIEGTNNGYDISLATPEEIKELNPKHVFANNITLRKLVLGGVFLNANAFKDSITYTYVKRIKDDVIFVNKWN